MERATEEFGGCLGGRMCVKLVELLGAGVLVGGPREDGCGFDPREDCRCPERGNRW